jgi:hypothetical protein
MAEQVTVARLEDQIEFYDGRSGLNQKRYKSLKILVIFASALIPLLSGLSVIPTAVIGGLGALIAIVESIQQVGQYHSNWISYRSTAEALKHEKFLYLAGAGAYAGVANATALLAERIEALVSQENAKWTSVQQREPGKPGDQPEQQSAQQPGQPGAPGQPATTG